ncbi:alpha/beta fold hydrolase [Psychromonas sp. L1A2]|uniref:alpha/beta fold hydrolase n=1 Tax=Psychromonas sp. L1A2 TaxID=2686356 RepID=UPI00135B7E42|nr:alpha/beta fold hydrolase [Psychromonas sp. L1A2]
MTYFLRALLLPFLFTLLPIAGQADIPMLESKSNSQLNSSLDNKYELNTEVHLDANFSPAINTFWNKHAQIKTFDSEVGGTINTVHIKTGSTNAIVISQGRNESVLKYKELVFDLSNQGYDVFLIDHRGQGYSSRLGGDAYRGHVQEFNDYIIDLTTFINSLQLEKNYQSRFILSHSMGSAISALYLEEQTHPFTAAVFFSPMLSINLGSMPPFIAKAVSYISDLVCSWFSDLACYAPGVGPYIQTAFEHNILTSSVKRYQSSSNTFKDAPVTQLGGPTMRWVNKSLFATEKAIQQASKINIPIMVIKAGRDTVVTEQGQNAFFANTNDCKGNKLIRIENARHELLLEQDQYRIPAINEALDFFQQSQQGKLSCIK